MATVCLHELNIHATRLLTNALRKVLSSTSTWQTVAQIIDDMPIKGHYYGLNYLLRHPHPEIENRNTPSEEATKLAQKFCSELDLSTLTINVQTAEGFQSDLQSSPDSISTSRRLLEILSSLVHDLTSRIHHELHPAAPKFEDSNKEAGLEHRAYRFSSGYKHRRASIVGYWAETDIFGGPLLFEKGEHGVECSAAFMHLTNSNILEQPEIVELDDEQVSSFAAYAMQANDNPSTPSCGVPLPFKVVGDARRLTTAEAVSRNIYRDLGQLSREWEADRKYERSRYLGLRPDGSGGCVH